jgi:hypothetical protein
MTRAAAAAGIFPLQKAIYCFSPLSRVEKCVELCSHLAAERLAAVRRAALCHLQVAV